MSEPKDYVSAYKWDNYCQMIYDRVHKNMDHMKWELGELYSQNPSDLLSLLHYYKKWHYNKELYQVTCREFITRKYVIENMLKRGYGVNIDLANALGEIEKTELANINRQLGETFYRQLAPVQTYIFMPQEYINDYNSSTIIREICKKLLFDPESNIPFVPKNSPDNLPLKIFFDYKNIAGENITFAIFKKMFLTLGETSKTIMKGSIGYEDFYSPQYLKTVANNNLKNLFEIICTSSIAHLTIDLDLLKQIHYFLYSGLDTPYTCRPGEFRTFDFDDRNGVTVEEGKFLREVRVLEGYLKEINWQSADFYELIRGLSEVYHLIIAIHPFSDANGRVGKCFVNYIMLVKGLMPLIFEEAEEVLSLPRYGSSLLDIEAYFKNRILYSIDYYVRELKKIEKNGNLHKETGDVDFDSGFHFRTYRGYPLLIEVNFIAYVVSDPHIVSDYEEKCRVIFPSKEVLYNMEIYTGLSYSHSVWEKEICMVSPTIEEIGLRENNIRLFDVTLFLLLENEDMNYEFLEISVASSSSGQIFNNKGLNYCYKLKGSA